MGYLDHPRYRGVKWCPHGINEKCCNVCQKELESKKKSDKDKKIVRLSDYRGDQK